MCRQNLKRFLRAIPEAVSNFPGLSDVNSAIPVVFVMGIGTMLVIAAAEWTLLLYLNYVGFTSPTDPSFYIFTFATALVVPVFSNIVFGIATSCVGPGITLSLGYVIVALGMLLLVFSRSSKAVFFIGYVMYACATSFRVIRLSIISTVVCPEHRTAVMAGHQLMAPIGALLGPLLWLILQLWQGHITILCDIFVVDRFTINYLISGLVMLGMSVLAYEKLRFIHVDENNGPVDCEAREGETTPICKHKDKDYGTTTQRRDSLNPEPAPLPNEVTMYFADGSERRINLRHYRIEVFSFFCLVLLGVSLTMGIFNLAFQPILINIFKASDDKVAMIFTIVAVLAILPPLMIAVMSRVMSDRQILLFGLSLKLVGAMMFIPILGKQVHEWQVVMGFVLLVKGSNFFVVATISLFTKILGPLSSSALLGWLWSVRNIGPAIAQLMLSTTILDHFGGWSFAIFGAPSLFSFALVLSPSGWKLLDPNSEMTLSILTALSICKHVPLMRESP